MDPLLANLLKIQDCLREAALNLRNQQALASWLDEADECRSLLLWASIRTFAWLENQRNGLVQAIGERLQQQPQSDSAVMVGTTDAAGSAEGGVQSEGASSQLKGR
jgi:hypothetical protein